MLRIKNYVNIKIFSFNLFKWKILCVLWIRYRNDYFNIIRILKCTMIQIRLHNWCLVYVVKNCRLRTQRGSKVKDHYVSPALVGQVARYSSLVLAPCSSDEGRMEDQAWRTKFVIKKWMRIFPNKINITATCHIWECCPWSWVLWRAPSPPPGSGLCWQDTWPSWLETLWKILVELTLNRIIINSTITNKLNIQ